MIFYIASGLLFKLILIINGISYMSGIYISKYLEKCNVPIWKSKFKYSRIIKYIQFHNDLKKTQKSHVLKIYIKIAIFVIKRIALYVKLLNGFLDQYYIIIRIPVVL